MLYRLAWREKTLDMMAVGVAAAAVSASAHDSEGKNCSWPQTACHLPSSNETARRGLTAEQKRLVARLFELQTAHDGRGIAALEREAKALARDVRRAHPAAAGAIHSVLGNAYWSLGDFPRAIEYLSLIHI